MALSPFGARARADVTTEPVNEASILERFGVLQPQEVILGLFGEYVYERERAWSGGMVNVLGDLGFSSASSRVALSRVIGRGLLAPVKEGRFVFYVVTPHLKFVLQEGRRQTFLPVADIIWSGNWTVVWYTIPEEHRAQRARLGRWLNLRGFGALQDSTWIAPGNHQREVIELADRLKLRDHVVVFAGATTKPSDIKQIVSKGWKVNDLKTMYDIFVKEFAPNLDPKRIKKLDPREALVTRTRLIEMFRTTTSQDPQLPEDVIGVEWRRKEAIEIFQFVQEILRAPATEYFRSHVVTGLLT
jgi:phenylacetic acid degradation operon negative regulatory protein